MTAARHRKAAAVIKNVYDLYEITVICTFEQQGCLIYEEDNKN